MRLYWDGCEVQALFFAEAVAAVDPGEACGLDLRFDRHGDLGGWDKGIIGAPALPGLRCIGLIVPGVTIDPGHAPCPNASFDGHGFLRDLVVGWFEV